MSCAHAKTERRCANYPNHYISWSFLILFGEFVANGSAPRTFGVLCRWKRAGTQEVENFSDIAIGRHSERQLTNGERACKSDSVAANAKIVIRKQSQKRKRVPLHIKQAACLWCELRASFFRFARAESNKNTRLVVPQESVRTHKYPAAPINHAFANRLIWLEETRTINFAGCAWRKVQNPLTTMPIEFFSWQKYLVLYKSVKKSESNRGDATAWELRAHSSGRKFIAHERRDKVCAFGRRHVLHSASPAAVTPHPPDSENLWQ